ncbi:MAG: nucleotidyltransferase domain-containing protein [bacterium]|nr:nucleotidyltransferase domain-containing protein [bacterium]
MSIDVKTIKLPEERLRKLDVALVYLFGSQAEGVAGPLSDIDIGVVFADPKIARGDTLRIYNELYNLLTDHFDMSNFRNIDIVFLERAPLELQFDAISHGITLFEISTDFRMNFEERTSALYRDFKPLLNEFNQAVLARI